MINPEPTEQQMEAVAVILNANGISVSLPWEGDMDDREKEVFSAVRDAVAVALRLDRAARAHS